MVEKFTTRKTPTVLFANCGHENTRRLEDCVSLGFISAGQGNKPFYFSNQIRNLIIGDILAVYRSKVGFVGIARVISKAVTIRQAYIRKRKVESSMFSPKANMFKNANNPAYAECLVEIDWLTEVHMSGAIGSGFCYGGVTPRYSIGELSESKYACLQKSFKVNFQELLNEKHSFIDEKNTINSVAETIIIDENEYMTFPEGREVFRLHKLKERNINLIKAVKTLHFNKDKKLCCQVCDFSFIESYGSIGEGFIEAHHIFPISQLTEQTEVKIKDIVIVCSNCHRMLHRKRPWLTLENLKSIWKQNE